MPPASGRSRRTSPNVRRAALAFPGFGKHETYCKVRDPYERDEDDPLAATLTDDILAVYIDLKEPLLMLDRDGPTAMADAVWEWQFEFVAHWGGHASDALRAIHAAIRDDIWKPDR
jgi:hypothetical protein